MIPKSFDYFAPASLPEAVAIISEYGDRVKVLAGGNSLIPLMKLGLASPRYILDINQIESLQYIKLDSEILRLGSLIRYYQIQNSPLIRDILPILQQTASHIGDPLVRNSGTIGGNVCHSDPANDMPAVILALEGTLVVVGSNGERRISAEDFFIDAFQTAIKHEEILTEVQFRVPRGSSGGSYQKLERKAGDFPIVGVACQIMLNDGGNKFEKVGIGLTAAGPRAIKARKAEQYAMGKVANQDAIEGAADITSSESDPSDDLKAPASYKKEMVKVLTSRALAKSLELARQNNHQL